MNFLFQSSMENEEGWWYGFKFSYANIADCKIAEKLAEVVKGTIFADAGYLQKEVVMGFMIFFVVEVVIICLGIEDHCHVF